MAGQVLRVVTFNANSFLEPAWPDRQNEIVAWLDRLQADVVCLQEIWQDAAHPNTASGIVDQMADAGTLRQPFHAAPPIRSDPIEGAVAMIP